MKFKTNKRYFFIYLISIILMVSIWGVTTKPPNEPQLQRQSSATERVEEMDIQYVMENKGVFDYVNEILTTVIGMINIIAFGYQMKERKRK